VIAPIHPHFRTPAEADRLRALVRLRHHLPLAKACAKAAAAGDLIARTWPSLPPEAVQAARHWLARYRDRLGVEREDVEEWRREQRVGQLLALETLQSISRPLFDEEN
jgi:hypothetical protein